MSLVTVQLGQCGNQIGAEFFRALHEEAVAGPPSFRSRTLEAFFREPEVCGKGSSARGVLARSVLIDMEPKVINTVMRGMGSGVHGWRYSSRSTLWGQSGSGNNWARGYYKYGPQLREDVCELVRREVERCDHLDGFLLLQSMAGGTGAGLGTYMAEVLREEYASSFIVSQCIWPYDSGEVIVQNYNTLLTLSHLLDSTDGIVLVPNEALHLTCQKLHNVTRPSFDDLNRVAARALASVLLPTTHSASTEASSGVNGGAEGELGRSTTMLGDVVQHLCAHPRHRVLSLRSVPQMPATSVDFTVLQWPGLLKRLRQMQITGNLLEEGLDWSVGGVTAGSPKMVKSVANWLVLRGKECTRAHTAGLADTSMYPVWSVDPLKVVTQPAQFGKYDKAAALLSNCQTFMPATEQMLVKAYAMYASRAYTHQYTQQGMPSGDFEAAFAQVEDCLAHYRTL